MGNTHWGLGIRLVFICFFLATLAHKCTGGGNLTTASCSDQERLALVKFKDSVRDDHGLLSSWGVNKDCCRWDRVGCDNATGRVVSLYLRRKVKEAYSFDRYYGRVFDNKDYYLVGEAVNSCLAELVNLKHLDLSGNDFQDSRIPEFIGSLKQLRYLNLSSAGFTGQIPHQIGNLSNLKVLDLSSYYSQQIRTHDMAWISGLSKLEHLDLSGVNLSRTQNFDNLLYTIPSLLKLRLSGCGISVVHLGSHHLNSSRKLVSIKHLDLSKNDFTSGLFLNMTSLVLLDLSWNDLSLAWSFGNLLNMIPSALELHLSGCKLNLSPLYLNSSIHPNIQHLDLSSNEISGKFPIVLTNMSSLLSLDLSDNMLNSPIPVMPNLLRLDISWNNFRQIEDVGIWRQCGLKELIVSGNTLEGKMIGPSTNVSKCPQNALEILYLDWNRLKCSIPEPLGRLTNLRRLDLSFNELTGPIPVSIGRLASLRVLSLSSNLLNGIIPNSIGQLTKLYILDISNNHLQGMVTEKLFINLSMLRYLDANSNNKLFFNFSREWIPPFQLKFIRLGSCKIEGGFPHWFRTQRKLKVLVLSNASISGPIPTWFRLLPIINVLDLSHNKLIGPLTNLPPGGILLLENNLFKGLIPMSLCTWTNLQVLDLSRNRLTGKIPNCLWNMSFNGMLLGSNRLSGVIPSPLGLNPSLRWLQLNDNNFNGELPPDFGYFKNLIVLDLGENKISGSIPEWIGEDLTSLHALRLHKNNFTGRIPNSLCKIQQLRILDLARNNLIGSIPHCFGELDGMKDDSYYGSYMNVLDYGSMMQVLKGVALDYRETLKFVINMDLSSNKLVGEIPEALMVLEALMGLNLSYNHFGGSIPENIGNLKSLNSLDLSTNELTGTIPQSMAALNFLSYLNLSHNNLSGEIPIGNQLQTLSDPSIYADNTYLCGAPLPKECSPHENNISKKKHKNANEPKKVWLYVDITSGFATGFWGIIGVVLWKKQWRDKVSCFVR